LPHVRFDRRVLDDDPPLEREDHRECVIADLVDAVVRHVVGEDAGLREQLGVQVVEADTLADRDAARRLERSDQAGGHLQSRNDQGVGAAHRVEEKRPLARVRAVDERPTRSSICEP